MKFYNLGDQCFETDFSYPLRLQENVRDSRYFEKIRKVWHALSSRHPDFTSGCALGMMTNHVLGRNCWLQDKERFSWILSIKQTYTSE